MLEMVIKERGQSSISSATLSEVASTRVGAVNRFAGEVVGTAVLKLTRDRKKLAINGFDPPTSGLWAQRAPSAPNRFRAFPVGIYQYIDQF